MWSVLPSRPLHMIKNKKSSAGWEGEACVGAGCRDLALTWTLDGQRKSGDGHLLGHEKASKEGGCRMVVDGH